MILIIDDEEIIREALEALLTAEGYAVTTTATAAEGLEALAARTPDVVGVMMKPNEEVSGQQLAGTRVKVSKDFFLMGLSAIELDVQHNMQVLKDRPWLGLPFVYNNNNRAVLSIEKGEAGGTSGADEIARWTAVNNADAPKR